MKVRRLVPFAFAAAVFSLLVVAGTAVAADSSPPPKFPSTEPGRHASAWFQAYNAGEPAMREFIAVHVAAAGLKRRPVEARLDVYRQMRDEHGAMTPIRVEGESDHSVTVIARTAQGGDLSIRFDCEPEAPHGLLGLLVMDAGGPGDGEEVTVGGGPRDRDRSGPQPGPPLADPALASAMEGMADSLAGAGDFSGAILLARDGAPLVKRAYGMADRKTGRPNRPETKFNLGSINKVFTQTAIFQLAEQGKLRLTETIDRSLPDYPKEKGSKITVQMLLDHTGGTGDIFRPEFSKKRLSLRTSRDWYAYVRDLPLDFEPGTRRAYSNAGYVLLGAIVEAASGMDYYEYMRDRVFRPAGMTSTDSYTLAERTADRAVGYTRDDNGPRPGRGGGKASLHANDATLPARGSGAGGGYSTLDDLARFVAAVRDGKLLGREYADRVVGQGMAIAGGSPGVNASLDVEGPYTMVVLANLDPPAAERFAMRARRLLRRAEGLARDPKGAHAGNGAPADYGTPGDAAPASATEDETGLSRPTRSDVPAEGVEVPMTLATHLPAVDVMVNGKGPFHFAIDTGGSGVARMDSAFAAALGLDAVGEVWGGDPSGKNRKRMDLVSVDSISIGGARFAGLRAATRSYNEPSRMHGVDGILGFGLFAGYTVTFDYPGGRLRIDPTPLPPADGKRVLAYTDDDGIPSIHIQVDSLDMVAHVDAGSMGGFILPERALARLPLAAEPRVIGRARTVSNTFEIKGAPLQGTLRIGDLEFAKPDLEFQPIMPDANVGSRVLRDFRLSFDTKNKRIRLTRAS